MEGHFFMATEILEALGVEVPADDLATIQEDPLFKKIAHSRSYRSAQWMKHIGYTRQKVVAPQPLGETEKKAAQMQAEIDELRRGKR